MASLDTGSGFWIVLGGFVALHLLLCRHQRTKRHLHLPNAPNAVRVVCDAPKDPEVALTVALYHAFLATPVRFRTVEEGGHAELVPWDPGMRDVLRELSTLVARGELCGAPGVIAQGGAYTLVEVCPGMAGLLLACSGETEEEGPPSLVAVYAYWKGTPPTATPC